MGWIELTHLMDLWVDKRASEVRISHCGLAAVHNLFQAANTRRSFTHGLRTAGINPVKGNKEEKVTEQNPQSIFGFRTTGSESIDEFLAPEYWSRTIEDNGRLIETIGSVKWLCVCWSFIYNIRKIEK